MTTDSTVHLKNLESGEEVVRTLAFPHGADSAERRVSILTTLGFAMLGCLMGDAVNSQAPGGAKRFRIESALHKPEAANENDRQDRKRPAAISLPSGHGSTRIARSSAH